MVSAAPNFVDPVLQTFEWGELIVGTVLLLWAIAHCARQSRERFAALGGLQKGQWLGLLGAAFFFGPFLGFMLGAGGGAHLNLGIWKTFIWVGIGAAAYYLLETRQGLKDVSEGPW